VKHVGDVDLLGVQYTSGVVSMNEMTRYENLNIGMFYKFGCLISNVWVGR